MPTILSDSLRQLGAVWKRLSNPSRVAVVATLLLAVGGLLFVTFWARTPSFVVLATDLEGSQASQVADALDGLGTEYRTRDSGRTILVPAGDIGRLRLKLAGKGLAVSDRAPDETKDSPWAGREERKAKRIRRLQSDVVRAIEDLSGVSRATVLISPGRDSPYTNVSRPPRAAIIVRTQANRPLSAHQVEGIVRTATNSVSGLTRENVSIVDGEGRPLTRRRKGETGGLFEDDITAYREAWERDLEATIAEILDGAIGPGHWRAAVRVEMSFDKSKTTIVKYDPEGRVLESEDSTKETKPVPGSSTGSDGTMAKHEQKNRVYRVPETTTEEIRNTPRILRVSAGVVVDEERAPEDLKALEEVLVRALGIADAAQDFSLQKLRFAEIEIPPDEETGGIFTMERILQIVQYAAAGLAGLGLLLFFRGTFRRSSPRESKELTGTHLDLTVGDDELSEERVPPKVLERQKLKREIERAIDQDPRGVAKLIEMWLHEEGA